MKDTLKRLLASIESLDNNSPPETVAKFIRNQYQTGKFDDNDCQILSLVYERSLKEKYQRSQSKTVTLNTQLADY